jgi:1,4-dihydroxy-2-naphthoate octaprenyltransferase
MNGNSSIISAMRVPFLVLSPACVLLAVAFASYQKVDISWFNCLIALIGALAAHVAVNLINEYQDFESGLDFKTKQTPFSGGSGLLPKYPHLAKKVWAAFLFSVTLLFLIGIYFLVLYGWRIVPLGLLGLLIIITYTKWINKNAILCLIAPGLSFGCLIVVGTYFCITGQFHDHIWALSFIPFFLVNNLLLLNQYPDIEADKTVNINHFPIRFGINVSNITFITFALLALMLLIFLVLNNILPMFSLITLVPISLSFISFAGMLKLGENISSNPKFMAANIACNILTPITLSITLLTA